VQVYRIFSGKEWHGGSSEDTSPLFTNKLRAEKAIRLGRRNMAEKVSEWGDKKGSWWSEGKKFWDNAKIATYDLVRHS
jgi:hypothetical protein